MLPKAKMFEARLDQGILLKKLLEVGALTAPVRGLKSTPIPRAEAPDGDRVPCCQAMKDLVSDANFECSPTALSLQAMDTSHVALVSMDAALRWLLALPLRPQHQHGWGLDTLRAWQCLKEPHGREPKRATPCACAGMNMANMSKCLKCASNDDIITLKVGATSIFCLMLIISPSLPTRCMSCSMSLSHQLSAAAKHTHAGWRQPKPVSLQQCLMA